MPRLLATRKFWKKSSGARKGGWNRWLLVLIPVLAFVGVATLLGYNYYTYRTIWGNPNSRPSYVTGTGTVETKTFDSEALGESLRYIVYLPPGYDDSQNSSVRYPVVYLLYGRPGDPEDWMNIGGAAEQMDTLLAQEQVQPMIVVVPQGSDSRWAYATGYVDGLQGDWETYITRDVVGEIDSDYRTVAAADGRAIAGLSGGGYGAMNLGLKNRPEFGVIGSFSGYFTPDEDDMARIFGGDQSLADANSPITYLPQLEGELPAIYFYVGQDDTANLIEQHQRLADELKARGASYDYETNYTGAHSWDLWREHLSDFFIFAGEHLARGE